jgi:hypothetical protein
MKAGWERASGLTAAELEELHGGPLTLHEIGMKDETLVRCAGADRELIWLHLENCREPTDRD